ncbi:MAG TPA: polysaccharide deacetylase family protein [Pseudonocardiaceae bacterium]|nr:polysaccharide deacetylase family protein [Pseudonocardiaceae bacterium]
MRTVWPAALAAAGLANAAPAAAFLPGLRRTLLPALAGHGDFRHVALTFDDGPSIESTPLFLDLLRQRDIRATFFVLGTQVLRAPDVARRIVNDGHEIAVHGWSHRCLLLDGPVRTFTRLRDACDVIETTTGVRPVWFRAPYGVFSACSLAAARALWLTPVLWSAWGFDWTRRATGDSVHRTVRKDLRGGGTILLHDCDVSSAPGSWKSTLDALPRVLDDCARRDLRVGPLRDHAVGQPAASRVRIAAAGSEVAQR